MARPRNRFDSGCSAGRRFAAGAGLALALAGAPCLADGPRPVFHAVGPDGASAPVDPYASGFAIQVPGVPEEPPADAHAPVAARERSAAPASDRDPGTAVRVTVRPGAPRPAGDPFAEQRCERFGFYYTTDGRCVAPAGGPVRRGREPAPR